MFRSVLLLSATLILCYAEEPVVTLPNDPKVLINKLDWGLPINQLASASVLGSIVPSQQQSVVSNPVSTVPVVSSNVPAQQQQSVLAVQPQVSQSSSSAGDISNYVVANAAEQQQPVIQANQQQLLTNNQNLPENFIIPVVIPIVRKSPVNILNLIQRQPVLSPVVQSPVVQAPHVQPALVQPLPLDQPTTILPPVQPVNRTAVEKQLYLVEKNVPVNVTQVPVTVTPLPPINTPVVSSEHAIV